MFWVAVPALLPALARIQLLVVMPDLNSALEKVK
jgi:hypothetical protein